MQRNLKNRDDIMKILIHKSGYIDLEAPIQMTEEQQEKFREFFKKMFSDNIEICQREEMTKKFRAREVHQKKWTIDEYALLLTPHTNADLATKMNRTEMGIIMRRGDFVFNFYAWMQKKGYLKYSKALIKEYVEEKGIEYEDTDRR